MRTYLVAVVAIGAFVASSSAANSAGAWQTVSLDNNPDFTIDVPTVVGSDYLPGAKSRAGGQLMFYVVTWKPWGGMYCSVYRLNYSDFNMNRDTFVARLAAGAGDVLCAGEDSMTNRDDMENRTLTSNGLPASLCTVGYADPGQKDGGSIISVLAVAGKQHAFEVQCGHNADTQEDAEGNWEYTWTKDATHVQQSLHLPPSEK